MYQYVTTPYYEAPELLCEISGNDEKGANTALFQYHTSLKISFPVDIWSVGCILAELFVQNGGRPIFEPPDKGEIDATINKRDHLAAIVRLSGMPDDEFMQRVTNEHIRAAIKELVEELEPKQIDWFHENVTPSRQTFDDELFECNANFLAKLTNDQQVILAEDALNLLTRMLTLNPNSRVSASVALQSDFVRMWRHNREPAMAHGEYNRNLFEKADNESKDYWRGNYS